MDRIKRISKDLAIHQLHVTTKTKERFLTLKEGNDYHEDIVVRLLNFWEEGHKENDKNETEGEVLG